MRELCCASACGVLLVAVGLAGCRSTGSDETVVHIDGRAIATRATVDHWISVMTAGRSSAGVVKQRYRPVAQQVLRLLISWHWLIDQAAEDGLKVSGQDVSHRVSEREQASFPGGRSEVESYLQATGETMADLKLEIAAELAGRRLRQMVASRTPRITPAEVAEYYRRHMQSYVVRERRDVMITNRKTYVAAAKAKREVESGTLSASRFPEELRELPRNLNYGARPQLERAIRAAAPNVPTGPVKQLAVGTVYDYFVFEVKRVLPETRQPLAEVRRALRRRLAEEAQRHALERFIGAWRRKWVARTDCSAGYVVQKCRRYKGVAAPEDPLRFE
jgi:hypothetical protein